MKSKIPYRARMFAFSVVLALGLSLMGCKADQLSGRGAEVVLLYDEPLDCENLGEVIGRGGGLTGAYSKPSINEESAENDVRNQAAERGATHLLLRTEEVAQGDGRQPDEKDTEPALAHGYGTGSNVTIVGTAFKCPPGAAPTTSSMSIQRGTALIEIQKPNFDFNGAPRAVEERDRLPEVPASIGGRDGVRPSNSSSRTRRRFSRSSIRCKSWLWIR